MTDGLVVVRGQDLDLRQLAEQMRKVNTAPETSLEAPETAGWNQLMQILLGQQVEVCAVPESGKSIEVLRKGPYSYEALERKVGKAKGRVEEAVWDQDNGGYLLLQGRWGRYYQAAPLIDKANDYAQPFSVRLRLER